ncbi:hypothetical protein BH24ACT26_BH24ACT26_20120 [soil metagenome]
MTSKVASAGARVGGAWARPFASSLEIERRTRVALVLAAMATAGALGFVGLDDKSIWLDEAFSADVARLGWDDLWRIVAQRQANMGLHYVLLHLWIGFGDGEVALRSLSVLATVLTVPLVYALGARLFDAQTGLATAGLIAVNAYAVRYAQEARGYALALLLTTAATLLFVRGLQRSRWSDWAGYALTGALATYAHFFAAFVLAAHGLSLAFRRRRDVPWKALLASYAGLGALLGPLALFVVSQDRGQIDWIPRPTPADLVTAFRDLTGQGGPLLLALYAGLGCVFVIAAWRTWARRGRSSDAWRYALLLAWLFVPALGSFGLSFVKPIFQTRYLVVSLPALALIAVVGLLYLGRPLVIGVVALALLAGSAYGLFGWYTGYPKEDWRSATRFVLSYDEPGDGVLFFFVRARRPFEHYLAAFDSLQEAPEPVYPPLPWGTAAGLNVKLPSPRAVERRLSSLDTERYPRIWLVTSHVNDRKRRSVQALLAKNYERVTGRHFTRVDVALYDARPTP